MEYARELMAKGGPVMWPLLALSLVSLTMILNRGLFWLRVHRPGRSQWVFDVAERLRAGDEPGVRAIAAGDRTVYGPLLRAILETPPHDALSIELVERFRPTFERFTTWLSATITAAPLLGILGSVSGIIRSLGLMSKAGHVSSVDGAVAGIAEALIATAFGLSVALITLFPYVLCRAHTDRAIGHMELLVAAWSGGRAKSKRTD